VIFTSAGGERTVTQSGNPEHPLITIKGKATTFTLDEGVILSGTGEDTNAIVVGKGTFVMNGGTISGSKINGVSVDKGGLFVMNGGVISGNGRGVYSSGTFTMTGGSINGNTAGSNGGGVYSSGTFTMTGGVISGNTALNGGGVYGDTRKSGRFTKSGGIIYGSNASENLANKAKDSLVFDGSQDNGDAILLLDDTKLVHYTGIDNTADEKTVLDSRKRNSGWEWSKGF
jgi:hypothetical protein